MTDQNAHIATFRLARPEQLSVQQIRQRLARIEVKLFVGDFESPHSYSAAQNLAQQYTNILAERVR